MDAVSQPRVWTRSFATLRNLVVLIIIASSIYFLPNIQRPAHFQYYLQSPTLFNESAIQTSFAPNDWSHHGLMVKQLADWGAYYSRNRKADNAAFLRTIEQSYTFLQGSLIDKKMPSPWTNTWNNTRDTGIVVSVGSKDSHLAADLILNLRRVLQSTLPIEIAYVGDKDLPLKNRDQLRMIDPTINFLDLLEIFPLAKPDLEKTGWAIKPFALLAATHPRTILVDADAIFFQKPDALFDETPQLKETGALFYHDRVTPSSDTRRQQFILDQLATVNSSVTRWMHTSSLFWTGKARQEADSGLVAIDKSRPAAFLGLVFACWLNTKRVREEVTYKQYHGDKETFWIAMELSKAPYTFPDWYAGQIGTTKEEFKAGEEAEICSAHMLHVDLVRRELFWFNAGIYEHKRHKDRGFANMTHYWMQFNHTDTANQTIVPPWDWKNGTWCIKDKGFQPLREGHKDILARTMREAAAVERSFS